MSTQSQLSRDGAAAVDRSHSHRWRIDEPGGPASAGVCADCGATKQFKNAVGHIDPLTRPPLRSGRLGGERE